MDPALVEEFTSSVDSVREATASIMIVNIIVQLILQQSLKNLWAIVNLLQFVVYLYRVKVNIAAHANLFLEKLKVIAHGEFIPYDLIISKMKEKFNLKYNLDFENIDLIKEMGEPVLIGALIVFIACVFLLLGRFKSKLSETHIKIIQKLKVKMIWNAFIRYSIQEYLKIGLASLAALAAYRNINLGQIVYATL